MATGIVKSKGSFDYNTPNQGILIDLATNLEYAFMRPDSTGITTISDWNVKEHDVVTFDISGGNAINVILYKKHRTGIVYSVT